MGSYLIYEYFLVWDEMIIEARIYTELDIKIFHCFINNVGNKSWCNNGLFIAHNLLCLSLFLNYQINVWNETQYIFVLIATKLWFQVFVFEKKKWMPGTTQDTILIFIFIIFWVHLKFFICIQMFFYFKMIIIML